MRQPHPAAETRTYLVECFGPAGVATAAGPADAGDAGFLATLAIAADDQLLVLVQGPDAGTVAQRCIAAGLTVDRVVEVLLSPAWRWAANRLDRRPRAPASRR